MVNVFGGRGFQALSNSGFRTKKQSQEGDTIPWNHDMDSGFLL